MSSVYQITVPLSRLTPAILVAGAILVIAACTQSPFFPTTVDVTVGVVGHGRVHIPAPALNIDCYRPPDGGLEGGVCFAETGDAGLGGTFNLVAEPATGWQFGNWSGDCSGTMGPTCSLSFTSGSGVTHFNTTVTFVPLAGPVMFQDDFESGCNQWVAFPTINGPGSTSEGCPATGGSDGGGYRYMIHDLTDQGDIVVEHVFSGDLLVGPGGGSGTCATTVRFQEQRVLFDPSPGETIGSSVWLRQSSGGIYHVDAGSFSNSDWTAYDSGQLTAADFTPSGLDLCPSSPSTITFGYSRSSTNASAGTTLFQSHGIDEWSVTISP